ncbi:MAG: ribose-phosphate pyrophosphokinase [Armatimonadetes bacterium]|nr:ribose-phosphate pyrophosphokinase [Armatimonadota bacterium]
MSALRPPMALFSGTAHPELAAAVAQNLGIELGPLKITRFPDSEIYIKFEDSVRGTDAFVLQPTCAPIDANLLELLILLDALKRASANSISVVLPYYGYARQEKKDRPREPITAKLIANLLVTAGADRIVAMDLHADAIQGFFDIPVDHLTAIGAISDYLATKNLENTVVVSPDEGRVKKVRKIASRLHCPLAVGYKFRPGHGIAEISGLAGDVKGKTCIIYDDMISTGGSINEIIDMLIASGANPEIYVACTHAVLAGPAVQRLSRPEIKELIVTDTIPLSPEKRTEKTTIISVSHLFAEAIRRIWTGDSVSELFND